MTERQGVRLGASLEDLVVQTLSIDTATMGWKRPFPFVGTAGSTLGNFYWHGRVIPAQIFGRPGPRFDSGLFLSVRARQGKR